MRALTDVTGHVTASDCKACALVDVQLVVHDDPLLLSDSCVVQFSVSCDIFSLEASENDSPIAKRGCVGCPDPILNSQRTWVTVL